MISFIIVSYNSGSTIFKAIDAIKNSTDLPYEILVVDNCSPDKEYLEKLKKNIDIVLIESNENLGFSKANNLAVKQSLGDKLFFVNPDVFLNKLSTLKILDSLQPNVVVSSTLYDESGKCNNSVYLIPFISNYIKNLFFGEGKFWVHGALLVFNRIDFFKVGMWSEDFFMYSEDIDLCNKIHLNKLDLKILNERVIHVGGTSTSSVWDDLERAKIVEKSSFIFYRKFNKKIDFYLINLLVLFKMFLTRNKVFKNKFLAVLEVFKNV